MAACPDEANEFFDYVTSSAAGSLDGGGDLQIMFGIGGERDLTERELPHLEGWRHSVPVRVGNGAWKQRQLDVYGELLSAVNRLSDHLRSCTWAWSLRSRGSAHGRGEDERSLQARRG